MKSGVIAQRKVLFAAVKSYQAALERAAATARCKACGYGATQSVSAAESHLLEVARELDLGSDKEQPA